MAAALTLECSRHAIPVPPTSPGGLVTAADFGRFRVFGILAGS